VIEEGAQIVADPNQSPVPMTMIGHGCPPPTGRTIAAGSIAMGLVADGRALKGKTLYVPMPERTIEVEITDSVFVDKEGVRLNG
jgi:sarcosine oxidase subunit alpha